jgi:thiol-disulfide isomerase/thioredoxin
MKNTIMSLKILLATLFLILSVASSKAQVAGTAAPDFTLFDLNGNKVSLSDYKGKVVYLDFWATWCRACVEEIPHSKKLQEAFKDNPNIVFINISFDEDVDKWKKKVKSKKMSGIQLISPEGSQSKVMKDYQILYLPTFLLIDKNGLFVNKRAKSPSMEGIEEDLNKVINQ